MRQKRTGLTKVIALTALILAITSAVTAQGRDLTGRWTGTFNRHGTPVTLVLNLKGSDNQVIGALTDPGGNQMPIQEWNLEGNQLAFTVSANEHGHPRKDRFVGIIEDDLIKLLQRNTQKYDPPIIFHRNKK